MDHGDFHPTVQDYFEAKASLFEQCKTGIFNLDDKFGRHLFDRKPSKNVYGISACESPALDADFSARNIILDENPVPDTIWLLRLIYSVSGQICRGNLPFIIRLRCGMRVYHRC